MRIAVVGSGVAGLGAAYVLSRAHEVVLFERDGYAGGHVSTVAVPTPRGELRLDTGFIVHNEANYPHLVRLFRELGVHTQASEMSFSVSCRRCGIEYSGRRPLAQPGNAARPSFLRLLRDVARWLRTARSVLDDERLADASLGEVVAAHHYSASFRDHFLVPLTAAIWSTAPAQALDIPAAHAVRFFENHGMLGLRRRAWRTVSGGSRTYVDALLERSRVGVCLRTPVVGVRRTGTGVEVRTADGGRQAFDGAVIAAHADDALALLERPTPDEQRLLGAFRYTANDTVLHTDEAQLPRTRAARASWNFALDDCRAPAGTPAVTYSLNRLQRLEEAREYCVTLNRSAAIPDDRVVARFVYHHPLYTREAVAAQRELPALNAAGLAFCGAYQGYGFHEDGLVSGLAAARAFGVEW